MLRFKTGVSIKRATPQLIMALAIAEQAFEFHHYDCVVTSGDEGQHSIGSLHPLGLAADLRSKHIASQTIKNSILQMLKTSFDKQFDVILEHYGEENEHYHIEYDPK